MDIAIINFMQFHGYLWSNELNRFVTRKEASELNLNFLNEMFGQDYTDIIKNLFGEK